MWLLNASTRQHEYSVDETRKYGRYAILSHTWDDEEVTFQDIQSGHAPLKKGYSKIENACRRALEDKLEYCWVDTCCIDKTSSAELSEAINSMYRWYYQAKVCYAYLQDVPTVAFPDAKWFTRGWTLQELIAPGYVEFYNQRWERIGSKVGMISELSEITHIDEGVLRDRTAVMSQSVASRMAWAAERHTSRVEDRAYSLLGLFDVSMPLLYGEGSRAFTKLQEEIISRSADHSILAWQPWDEPHSRSLFAPSPLGFRHAHKIISWSTPGIDESFQLSNKGLRISLPTVESQGILNAVLNCREKPSNEQQEGPSTRLQIALLLRPQLQTMTVPAKKSTTTVCEVTTAINSRTKTISNLRTIERKFLPSAQWVDLLILREPVSEDSQKESLRWIQHIHFKDCTHKLVVVEAFPTEAWDAEQWTMSIVMTGSVEHDRGYLRLQDKSGKRRFALTFGQEVRNGVAEPRIALTTDFDVLSPPFAKWRLQAPRQSDSVKLKKGEELCAKIERQYSTTGDVDWVVDIFGAPSSKSANWLT